MSKVVKTRDSAVAVLRKLGVKKEDYSKFVTKVDGGFRVEITKAKANIAKPTKPEVVKPMGKRAKAAAAKAAKPALPPKEKKITVTSVTEGLIQSGKSNPDVWAVIKGQFKLSDDKRWYPSWFRSRLKRQGKLTIAAKGVE